MRNTVLTTSLPAPLLSITLAFALLLSIFSLASRPTLDGFGFTLHTRSQDNSLGTSIPTAPDNPELVPDGLTTSEWQQIRSQVFESQRQLLASSLPESPALLETGPFESGAAKFQVDSTAQSGAVFYASNAAANDQFGWSVDVDGDVVLVGAPYATVDAYANAGAAYLFERNAGGQENWGQVAVLRAPIPAADDFFGQSVAISGDTAAIGAHGRDDDLNFLQDAGAVFVFERNGGGADAWSIPTTVLASDAADGDSFGWSLDLDGNILVVGANLADAPQLDSGEAYVYSRNQGGLNSWGEVAILSPASAASGPFDWFGESVAVSNDTIVVGAPGEDGLGETRPESGTAYLFSRNYDPAVPTVPAADNWGQVAEISAADPALGDRYGTSVAIDNDTVVIGAPKASGAAGAAYVHLRNVSGADSWGQARKLQAGDAQAGDEFGSAVAISDDIIVIGAPLEDGGAASPTVDAGSTYIFERNFDPAAPTIPSSENWGERQKIPVTAAEAGDNLGGSIAVSGEHIVAGAPLEDGAGNLLDASGGVHLFENDGQIWRESKKLGVTNPAASDEFGYSVSVDGNTAVVGAWTKASPLANSGAAYVFQRNESSANGWGEVAVLTASNGSAADRFGVSVGISGDVIAVGADRASGTGAVYIFRRNEGGADNWGEVAILRASDAATDDHFGWAVAVDRGTLVVGAYGKSGGAGSGNTGGAYIFSRNFNPITATEPIADNWGQRAVLTRTPSLNAQFGRAVAISDDRVVIGAPGSSGVQGSAYLFDRNIGGTDKWGLSRILTATDPGAGDAFGSAVAIYHDMVLVGAPGEDGGPTNPLADAGAAYMFERNAGGIDRWGVVATLRGSQPELGAELGTSADLHADTAVVGARRSLGVGAAMVFERNEGGQDLWRQSAALRAADALPDDQFGTSVSIDGNTIVAGAPKVEGGAGNDIGSAGAAYVFMLQDEVIGGLSAANGSPTLLGSPTLFTATILSGTNVTYTWDFGDGVSAEGPTASHVFSVVGQHTVTVTAANILGTQAATTTVIIEDVPIAGLLAFNDGPTTLGENTLLSLTISAGTNVSYQWDFGDGQTGGGISPAHLYQIVGGYTATVTATNSAGSMSATTFVEVQDIPITGLSASNDSPTLLGQATLLTATITAGSNVIYQWNFGDGTMGSGKSASHFYSAIGTYTATVTATNGTSGDSASTLLVIQDVRVSDLSEANNGPLQLGQTAWFTASIGAGSNVVYTWDFDDGTFGSGQVVSHTYGEVGTFLAKVTAANSANSKSIFSPIVVGDVPINGLAAYNDGPTPFGSQTLLWATVSNGTNVSYAWDFGDGSTGAGQPISHVYPALGEYTATVTATNGAGTSVSTTQLEIEDAVVTGLDFSSDNPTPIGQVTTLTATISSGTNVQYQWDFGDGTFGSGEVVTHTFPSVGPFSVKVTASNDVSTLERTKTVTIVPIKLFLPVVFNKYPDQWESEPNGTYSDATGPILSGLEYYGVFSSIDDNDYFYFELQTAHAVTLTLTNIGVGHNFDLLLIDQTFKMVEGGYSGEVDNDDELIEISQLAAGRYYIWVYNRSKTMNSEPYHLVATFR